MTIEKSQPLDREVSKHPNYLLRRGIAGLAVALTAFGFIKGGEAVNNAFTYKEVGQTITTVEDGGTTTQSVQQGADRIAHAYKIDRNDITGVPAAADEVQGEIQQKTHQIYVQGGQDIIVTVEKNILGYKVSADPTNIPNVG